MFGGSLLDAAGAVLATALAFPISLIVERYIGIDFVTTFVGAFVFSLTSYLLSATTTLPINPNLINAGQSCLCTRDCFYKCCKRPHDQSYQYRDDQIFPNCAYYLIARCRYNCGLYACEVIYDTSSLLITGTRLLYRYRSLLNCSQCSKKNAGPWWTPRHACLAYLSFTIGTNKCLDCYLFAAIIGSCVSQIMSIWLKTPPSSFHWLYLHHLFQAIEPT